MSVDGTNATYQSNSIKFAAAFSNIAAQLSFLETELLTIPEDKLASFKETEPRLVTFKKMLDDIIEKKQYTLSAEIEEVLASLSEVHSAPYMIYNRSKSSDMQFESIKDDAGNEHSMSETLYEDRYEMSAETTIRRNAYTSFNKTLHQYKHTYAATYATEVTKQITLAKLRGYDSVTDMLLEPHQVTTDMYNNQLDIIQKELAPHMRRFAKLKQKDYGLDELH